MCATTSCRFALADFLKKPTDSKNAMRGNGREYTPKQTLIDKIVRLGSFVARTVKAAFEV
jgi:hypothetical protein